MFDIGCVTCGYRINEGSKTALSGDLQYIITGVQSNCFRPMCSRLQINMQHDKL